MGHKPGGVRQQRPGCDEGMDCRSTEVGMEAVLFFVIWLGGALLHTLFDLRIKPVLRSAREESDVP